jgi:hypothetical protein
MRTKDSPTHHHDARRVGQKEKLAAAAEAISAVEGAAATGKCMMRFAQSAEPKHRYLSFRTAADLYTALTASASSAQAAGSMAR